jgi:Mor family transcriptional regulator
MSTQSNRIVDVMHSDIMTAIKDSIGLHDHIAVQLADDVMRKLQTNWGGREIYIPAPGTKERNEQIKADFYARGNDPTRYVDVCRIYSISLRTLYRVLGR